MQHHVGAAAQLVGCGCRVPAKRGGRFVNANLQDTVAVQAGSGGRMLTLTRLGGQRDIPHPPGAPGGGSSLFLELGKALTIKKTLVSYLFSACVFRFLGHQTLGNTWLDACPAVSVQGGHNLASS